MSDQFLGEIRTVAFSYAPLGWALCNGQILPIAQNTALFSLLGASYGGDGRSTFALPNLNASFAIGQGQGPGLSPRHIGEIGGTSRVTLLSTEMPTHTHAAVGVAGAGTTGDPQGRRWAQPRFGRSTRNAYAPAADTAMAWDAVGLAGGDQSHENMPPYLGLNFVIALEGIYPPRG
ncbi:phage tail protein [Microbacterium sp. ZW T5_45]|uniref:phage tail protein n=1 Tax=Microbacterium sp. ZW T5_45 TaxID=3378080 RepID=UPI003852FC58